jgi:hypothetical protein
MKPHNAILKAQLQEMIKSCKTQNTVCKISEVEYTPYKACAVITEYADTLDVMAVPIDVVTPKFTSLPDMAKIIIRKFNSIVASRIKRGDYPQEWREVQ